MGFKYPELTKLENTQFKHHENGCFAQVYDWDTVWPDILRRIGNGSSLLAAAKAHGIEYSTVKKKLAANPDLKAKYEIAVEARADYLADELLELADAPPPDLDGPALTAWINQLKIRLDTRKWIAGKLRPKTWGERTEINLTSTSISITTALQQAEARLNTIDITPNTIESLSDDSK